jgi:hypothetical protein
VELSQQVGRAGRDGNPARSIIFYGEADLTAKKPEIHQSMIEFVRNSNNRCLRDMMLSYLGDTFVRQTAPCCGYCNYGSMNLETLLARLKVNEDQDLSEAKPAPKMLSAQVSDEFIEVFRTALKDLRYKKAMSLPQGALIHGVDSVIFSDETIERIVNGMRTIRDANDVINLTGGMIYNYADEIAKLVGDIRVMDAVGKAHK